MDDQFATAEARCDDLQEKIDLIKSLKRKRKLKKRRYHPLPTALHLLINLIFIWQWITTQSVCVFKHDQSNRPAYDAGKCPVHYSAYTAEKK